MKQSKISIKWGIFWMFSVFTVLFVAILWLFEIVYLDDFYTFIKRNETKSLLEEAQEALAQEDAETQLDQLASENASTILVLDVRGEAVYRAEYNMRDRISEMSREAFLYYYEQAKSAGGEALFEYEGDAAPSKDPTALGNPAVSGDSATPLTEFARPLAGRSKSVLCVRLVNFGGRDAVLIVYSMLTPVEATVSTIKIQLIIITIVLLAVAVLFAWLGSRGISRPLVRLKDEAEELARGNYGVKFEENAYREIARLSETLNYAARELEKTEDLRRELIANVSHDLRTPLTMIKAYSEVMRDLPGENTAENIQVVIDETQRLTNLVNDMLDVSKLEANTVELHPEEYAFTEDIEDVLGRYNKLREQEGYVIDFRYEEKVTVEADREKMYQVLYNLINNAINYTGDDKRVTVRQTIRGNRVRIDVVDSGDGVAPADLPYVFDRYYKVDKAHKRAVMGTGLGLSIVKKVLELHHAVYGVDSSPGQGADFWFELPLRYTDAPKA